MALRADRLLAVAGTLVLAVLFLGGCSQEKRTVDAPLVGERATTSETPEIVPSPAYSYHQLRLGSDASAASFGGLTGADKGQLVIWAVNGKPVFTGPSLDPSYTQPGDHVTAIVKSADVDGTWRELTRYETEVLNSPPRVEEVQLQRDASNPYLIHAVLLADDPDGPKPEIAYSWFVNGQLVPGQNGPQLLSEAGSEGAEVRVEVIARDGESQSQAVRSPAMRVEAPTVFLEVSNQLTVTELEDGGREYHLPFEHSPDAQVEFLDAPSSVRRSSGEIVWSPGEDETELRMRVRVLGADGSSVERDVHLQR